MDIESRKLILSNKQRLSQVIDLVSLRPILEKYKIFTNAMLRDVYEDNNCDFFLELTSRGPHAFESFKSVLQEANNYEALNILQVSNNQKAKIYTCYKMNSKPLGFCKIINNVDFDNEPKRFGSDLDAQNLRDIFVEIGFSVDVVRNQTGECMRRSIEEFSKNTNWASVDACLLIILSHGLNINNLDQIYGTDSVPVKKIDIYKMFDGINCYNLINKPKIFIFQACRGKQTDCGVRLRESSDAMGFSHGNAQACAIPSYSSTADMIAVHSSLPYYVSIRHELYGAWFVQDLCKVLREDYAIHDFSTMMNAVNRLIMQRVSQTGEKEAVHVDNLGLQAALYFRFDSLQGNYEFYDPIRS